jgi:hypothetical protein
MRELPPGSAEKASILFDRTFVAGLEGLKKGFQAMLEIPIRLKAMNESKPDKTNFY